MKSLREKAADLVRLATAPTAEPGERANAALAACRLIQRHGMLLRGDRDFQVDHDASQAVQTIQSELVVLATAGLCRACMQRIEPQARRHVIGGRGYQCEECGPWSARVAEPARARR